MQQIYSHLGTLSTASSQAAQGCFHTAPHRNTVYAYTRMWNSFWYYVMMFYGVSRSRGSWGEMGRWGFGKGRGKRCSYFPKRRNRLWGPPSLLFILYRGSILEEVERPGRKVVHSPPSSFEVTNAWSRICTFFMSLWYGQTKFYIYTFTYFEF